MSIDSLNVKDYIMEFKGSVEVNYLASITEVMGDLGYRSSIFNSDGRWILRTDRAIDEDDIPRVLEEFQKIKKLQKYNEIAD